MKRVLVTGATGFIGRQTLSFLNRRGYEVHALTSRPAPADSSTVKWHHADLFNDDQTRTVIADVRPSHLLHFAWYAEPGKFWQSDENFRWLEASLSLLRNFADHGGRRVVMSGSCAEYDWSSGLCSETSTPCRPATPYGTCKNALHEALSSFCSEKGLSGAWGRIFFLYGPGEHRPKLVASVVSSLLQGQAARCTHGNQVRDFLHVEDVASAFVALLDSKVEGAVNIASGNPTTIRDIVLMAADQCAARERVEFGAIAAPANEPPLLVADVRRLRDEVGWMPEYQIATGLEQTVQWWKSQLQGTGSK